jgi:hypothetical protein
MVRYSPARAAAHRIPLVTSRRRPGSLSTHVRAATSGQPLFHRDDVMRIPAHTGLSRDSHGSVRVTDGVSPTVVWRFDGAAHSLAVWRRGETRAGPVSFA